MKHELAIMILWMAGLFAGPASAQTAIARYESSVVVLHVTKQAWNIDVPWTRQQVQRELHLGTMVAKNLFLTTAQALAAANLVELQRYGEATKHKAEIVHRDYEANLAVVRLEDAKAVSDMTPIRVGESELPLMSQVTILHGTGDRIYGRNAELRRVDTKGGHTSPYPFPTYELEVNDGNGLGLAEPVISSGRLVGITTGRNQNIVNAHPGMVVTHYIKDKLTQDGYRGFPFVGIATNMLVSPDWRQYLGVKVDGGVRVSEIHATSPFVDVIKEDDVIIAVDNVPLDARGNYAHQHWGKIFFSYLISKKYAGEDLTIKLIRKGKEKSYTRKMQRFDRNRSLLPYFSPDVPRVPHLIFAGLLFQELSREYLMTWGNDWQSKAPDRLLFYWYFRNDPPKDPSERIIVMNRVLSDPSNRGHQDLADNIVERVNGKLVKNMADLTEALDKPVRRNDENFAVFSFADGLPDVMIAYRDLEKAHARIAENYSVKAKSSFYLP